MKDQTLTINDRYPSSSQVSERVEQVAPPQYPEGAFWLHVYPPLGDRKLSMPNRRIVCPWTLAAELDDNDISPERRQNILEALKRGLKTIRQYDLPPYRILFAEDNANGEVSVWVD